MSDTAVPAGTPAPELLLTFLIFMQVVFVTMVNGPIAAFPVGAFPPRIRYTSLSLPYHFGNGWFGGFLPLIATALVARTGNVRGGLAFPITVSLRTAIVGALYPEERYRHRIWDEVHDLPHPEAA